MDDLMEELELINIDEKIKNAFLNKDKNKIKNLEEMKSNLRELKKHSYMG